MSLPPFEALVVEHGPLVLRVCRALLDPHDAQDAWSDTFLAALRAYPDLPDDSNVRGWLVTIAHRKALDVMRASNRAPSPASDRSESRRAPLTEPMDGTATFEAVVENADLSGALRALPFKQRGAVVAHHLAGLPYREVGQLLGCTEVAARRSASDGIAALRRALEVQPTQTEAGARA